MAGLLETWHDPPAPGSFGGADRLEKYSGRTRREVDRFLSKRDAYTLHRSSRLRFPRRKTFSKGIADLYQVDLVDLSNISRYNDGFRYLLCCIDVFTKQAWAVPIRTKSAREVADAMEKILVEQKPAMIQSDKGTEFLNSTFQSLLKRHDIKFYTSENEDIKAAVVERFNRTLKSKMYRYFTHASTRRYLDVLPDLLNSYNRTFHRSIGMAPVDVTSENEDVVMRRLYPVKPKTFKWKYRAGDRVRISMQRRPFRKGYEGRWSEEIFVIRDRLQTVPVTYALEDLAGEPIKGKFYEQEVQKVLKTDDETFDVERIVRTRKRAGKVEYLVKWRGYPEKFNSWVDALEAKS
jgi:Integrase core domain/Chromo (CHRromatin Organisation MOdifier) domain